MLSLTATETNVYQQLMLQYKCKKNLLFSTRYFYRENYGRKYTVRRHHQIMADALERVLKGEITRLIITIPPRYGKTELGVINFIPHGLALNPAALFLHLSASSSLALENSEKAREVVKSRAYQELFPEVRVKTTTDSKAKWYTDAGGGVYAASAAGQLQGFGAGVTANDEGSEALIGDEDDIERFLSEIEQKEGFAGAIIIDDSVKADDADSDILRQKVNRRYSSSIKSRLNSKKTPIIIIQQRLHELDLVGYVLETEGNVDEVRPDGSRGDWTVVNIPALYVDEQGQLQCLDATKHTVQDLLAMENNPDIEVRIVFHRQFQQNPQSREGLMFPSKDLRYFLPEDIDLVEKKEYVFSYTDPANKGGDDICSLITVLVGKDLYIKEVIYNTDGTDINGPRIANLIAANQCNYGEMEANFKMWIDFGREVQAMLADKYPDCELRLFPNTVNKHTRILSQSSHIRKYFVFRKDWQTCDKEYRKFMVNLTAYRMIQDGDGKATHDDAPDGCAGVSAHFRRNFPHLYLQP